ncbi:MAG: CAP domain-containing protein [Dehalococcoidia bacterium]|nr:CAP domain-containing protein [Dehalococcoidia bacterium]
MQVRIPLTRIIVAFALVFGGIGLLGLGTELAGASDTCNGEGAAVDSREQEMLDLINAAREREGVHPLGFSDQLNALAAWKSEDASSGRGGRLSHTDSLGRTTHERASDCGYASGMGENVAYGYPGVRSTFRAFMSSPGHRANMLSDTWHYAGIAADGTAWTLNFGMVAGSGAAAPEETPTPQPTPSPTATATPEPQVEVRLQAGLNLVTWEHAEAATAAVFGDDDDGVEAVYGWNAENGTWKRFIPGAPDYVNSLVTVQRGGAYFVVVTRASTVAY